MVISSKQKSVVTGVQKSNDMKQITTEVISTRIPMITKLIGIIQMSILYLAHRSIILAVLPNLSNM